MRGTQTLLVYARYDLTFPVALSRNLVRDFRALGLPHRVVRAALRPLQTGVSPFKWVDGYVLTKFLREALL